MKDVVFDCPKCKQLLEAPEDMVDLFVECPNCREVIQVPDGQKTKAPQQKKEKKSLPEAERKDDDSLKGSTIRIELPPNLGIPEAPKRKITIRRND